MTQILHIAALVAFLVAVVLCLVVDAPDVFDVLAAISGGLALFVAAHLVND